VVDKSVNDSDHGFVIDCDEASEVDGQGGKCAGGRKL